MASNSVLTPVSETPPETTTTTTTTPRSNKWARFQVYSKYRGSRTGLAQAGFGVAFGQALAADNITLIPRSLFFFFKLFCTQVCFLARESKSFKSIFSVPVTFMCILYLCFFFWFFYFL